MGRGCNFPEERRESSLNCEWVIVSLGAGLQFRFEARKRWSRAELHEGAFESRTATGTSTVSLV